MTENAPFLIQGNDRTANILILCDHATNHVPTSVNGGDLGLPAADMERHIAFDIGAAGISSALGKLLNAPVILSNFSRLVIDPNRGEDDPTLLMRLYDGTIIPANASADSDEKERRLDLFYRPYHAAMAGLIAGMNDPVLISVHSFTPQLRGRPKRPWHIGILFADDQRLSDPLYDILNQDRSICVGNNEPYSGALTGDTMDRQGINLGLRHALIEVRNDLIEKEDGQQAWAQVLATAIKDAIAREQTNG